MRKGRHRVVLASDVPLVRALLLRVKRLQGYTISNGTASGDVAEKILLVMGTNNDNDNQK